MKEVCMIFGFFAAHIKHGGKIDATQHWDMLRKSIRWSQYNNCPMCVVITGAVGLNAQEYQEIFKISKIAEVIEYQKNTGHCEGAGVTIREGLKWAKEKNYKYLIFTQEDVLLSKNTIERWISNLEKGADWVGRSFHKSKNMETKTFGCRVESMFDDEGCVVDNLELKGTFESRVKRRLKLLKAKISIDEKTAFFHSHNYNEFLRHFKKKNKNKLFL